MFDGDSNALLKGLATFDEALARADAYSGNSSIDEYVARAPAEVRDEVRALLEGEIGRTYGKFVIKNRVGAGGMGIVFRAEDPELGRTVALKFVPSRRAGPREARAAASLEHEYIIPIYESGWSEDGFYIVQQYIEDGRTLDDVLAAKRVHVRTREQQGAWFDECLEVFTKLARALHFAHTRGVLHLDLKPSNILISPTGQPKLADFGIAHLVDQQDPQTGSGTPGFMAPEQLVASQPTANMDVYSLGVCLRQALTLATARDVALRHRRPLAELPRRLDAVCAKAMHEDPPSRFQSMDELASALERLRSTPVRRPLVATGAGLALLLAAACTLWIALAGNQDWQQAWRRAHDDAALHWHTVERACEKIRSRQWDQQWPGYDMTGNRAWFTNAAVKQNPMGGDSQLLAALVGLANRNVDNEGSATPPERAQALAKSRSMVQLGPRLRDRKEAMISRIERAESWRGDKQYFLNSIDTRKTLTSIPNVAPKPWLDLAYSNIEGVTFPDPPKFSGLRANHANIAICDLRRAKFVKALLEDAQIIGCKAWGGDYREARMRRMKARSVDFGGCRFEGAWLADADLSECNFFMADLRWAVLPFARFDNAVDMSESNWDHCFAFHASFDDANFQRSTNGPPSLRHAYLRNASFVRAQMRGADLTAAVLVDADLTDAVLSGATLTGADLNGAVLDRTDLRNVDLTGVAAGLTLAQVLAATTDTTTVPPSYWSKQQRELLQRSR